MLSNLDSSGSDANASVANRDDEGDFLYWAGSLFRPVMDLLFCRLPPGLQSAAIKRVARFVLYTTLPSVTSHASMLCSAAALAAPELAGTEILSPLLDAIQEELHVAGPRHHLSAAAEGALNWHMGLAMVTTMHMGEAILKHAAQLQVLPAHYSG